jgi:hypothetical protein
LLDAKGVENRFVTEDYATSIKLHLLGKRGVFVSKVLAEGFAPMNLKEYFNQQTRWCKGCLDANGAYLKELIFGPLTWRQKFHYFLSTVYYVIGVRDAILVLAPLSFLFTGVSLVRANTNVYLALVYLPYVMFNFTLFFKTFTNPVKSLVLDLVAFPVFAKAFIASVVGKNLPFSITIKKYQKENPLAVYNVQLAAALVLIFGVLFSVVSKNYYNPYGRYINYFWALYSSIFLLIGFGLVVRENVDLGFGRLFKLPVLPAPVVRLAVVLLLALAIGVGSPMAYEMLAERRENIFTSESIETERYELLVPSRGIYYGYYMPELNQYPEDPRVWVNPGEQPSLTMFYQDWDSDSEFRVEFVGKLADRGVVPVITWEPWVAETEETRIESYEEYAPVVIASGKYDRQIERWAQAAAKYGNPVMLRFAHEMNGNWYPWGDLESDGSSSDDYIAMWRHVHGIFEREGAINVYWVWSPNNTDAYGRSETVLEFYPGDEYVDWVGYSAFNWGNAGVSRQWRDFSDISRSVYEQLTILNKPIMVAETSSVSQGGDKQEWFENMLRGELPGYSMIKALVMFNDNYRGADFSLNMGMSAYGVIFENVTLNDYYLKEPVLMERGGGVGEGRRE